MLLPVVAHAQVRPAFFDYVRPGLDWYTIETEHFNILFHADTAGTGSSRTAQVVARIAEDIYAPITNLYRHRPSGKVAIILKDYEDYSNGAAYFFDNKIEIWAPALDTPLRGDRNWLRNVITHEFTHIVQVQKTMKANRRLPFFYLQFLGYEEVKRPDVLYGYPNVLVTYPIPTLSNPAWLAEGTAQYQRAGLHYDRWDAHRDMLLRTRVLAGEELSLGEMGGFYSHTSLMREGVYNHGFAFTSYLAQTYGESALREVSAALGQWGNWNVERAIGSALGTGGTEVYRDWIAALREGYESGTADVRENLVEGELLEEEGFFNFYPRFSPDGGRLAYVSNQGESFSRTSLYVQDLESGEKLSYEMKGFGGAGRVHTCAFGHKLRSGVGGAFAWRPDGQAIVYARARDTREGYLYSDLYELDLETKKEKRLTRNLRAAAPAYAPGGQQIAFVQQNDGSTNLALFDLATEAVTPITDDQDGTQANDPTWHPSGAWIYFDRTGDAGRDLYRVRPDGTGLEAVLATDYDERSPAFDEAGDFLYFSSDRNGIFNLYRMRLGMGERESGREGGGGIGMEERKRGGMEERRRGGLEENGQSGRNGKEGQDVMGRENTKPETSNPKQSYPTPNAEPRIPNFERLTNVLGGAFMPAVSPSGAVAFAQYQWDGYKIALFDEAPALSEAAMTSVYAPPAITQKREDEAIAAAEWTGLNAFNDRDVRPLATGAVTAVRTTGRFAIEEGGEEETAGEQTSEAEEVRLAVEGYAPLFTSFSFFPALRLDQYTSPRSTADARLAGRTRGETLLRNTKAGVYVSSREILEGMTLFGGLLVGPASSEATSAGDFFSPSRLISLERDAFIQFDYNKGFGLFPQRWAPQVSIELYNLRRNVEGGLDIEEFPCTACLPDTTFADLAYNLWEANISIRSKVNRALLLEAGYRYSPYRVTTERFFSRELQQSIDASSSRYYIGRAYRFKAYVEAMRPDRDMDVVPEGLRLEAMYEYEPGRLLERFEVEDGLLVPSYQRYGVHRLLLDARFGMRLPGSPLGGAHGLGFRLHASGIPGDPVDAFFNDYVGGLIGARGYPFYALGGNQALWFQTSYLVPLLPRIERQVAFLYLDKLYARLYADAAMAWSGAWPGLSDVRKDVGAELRLRLGSFYLLPTSVFLSGTYSLDAFDFRLDDDFVTPEGRSSVRYGNEWLWHFGVLFEFDL